MTFFCPKVRGWLCLIRRLDPQDPARLDLWCLSTNLAQHLTFGLPGPVAAAKTNPSACHHWQKEIKRKKKKEKDSDIPDSALAPYKRHFV